MCRYMFRNAEYVLALKELLQLKGTATLRDYKDAFDRLDTDKSGYIESSEVKHLLDDVYDGKTPVYEVEAFLEFFDQNKDGRISWEEFERGLGAAMGTATSSSSSSSRKNSRKEDMVQQTRVLQGKDDLDDDDDEEDEEDDIDEDEEINVDVNISGTCVFVFLPLFSLFLRKK